MGSKFAFPPMWVVYDKIRQIDRETKTEREKQQYADKKRRFKERLMKELGMK